MYKTLAMYKAGCGSMYISATLHSRDPKIRRLHSLSTVGERRNEDFFEASVYSGFELLNILS